MLRGDGSVMLAVRLVFLLCVLTFLAHGCASTGGTDERVAPGTDDAGGGDDKH